MRNCRLLMNHIRAIADKMTLDKLLEQRSDIRARLSFLLDRDAREFAMLFKNRGKEMAKERFAKYKAAILGKRLQFQDTDHSTPSGITRYTFIAGRMNNARLEQRDIRQRLDISDAELLEHFVDYLANDKVAGQVDVGTAIFMEALALNLAASPSLSDFQELESQYFNKRKEFEKWFFGKNGNTDALYGMCQALYDKIYAEWTTPLSFDPKRHSSSRPVYDLAASMFMDTFRNQDLLRLVGLTTTKEEAKVLKAVDVYVSTIRRDATKRELVNFLLDPLPLFEQKKIDPHFNIWKHLKDVEAVRREGIGNINSELDALTERYNGFEISNTDRNAEAETAITKINSMVLMLADHHLLEGMRKVFVLKEHLVSQRDGFAERLETWKRTLHANMEYLGEIDAQLSSMFGHGFTSADAETLAIYSKKVDSITRFTESIDEKTIAQERDSVKAKAIAANVIADEKLQAYESYVTTVVASSLQTIESNTWDTQQKIAELEGIVKGVNDCIKGCVALSLDIVELNAINDFAARIENTYRRQLAAKRNELVLICDKERAYELELMEGITPDQAFTTQAGNKLYSFHDLLGSLKKHGAQFLNHYTSNNKRKAGLVNWIDQVLGAEDIAGAVRSKDKLENLVDLLQKRVDLGQRRHIDMSYIVRLVKLGEKIDADLQTVFGHNGDSALKEDIQACEAIIQKNVKRLDGVRADTEQSLQKEMDVISEYANPEERAYSQEVSQLEAYKARCYEISGLQRALGVAVDEEMSSNLIGRIDSIVRDINIQFKKSEAVLDETYKQLYAYDSELNRLLASEKETTLYARKDGADIANRLSELREGVIALQPASMHQYMKDEGLAQKAENVNTATRKTLAQISRAIECADAGMLSFCTVATDVMDNLLKKDQLDMSDIEDYRAVATGTSRCRPLYEAIESFKAKEVQHVGAK
jgi:hypothetical protein